MARLQLRTGSLATSNRVSAATTRILKNGDRRLACEIERWWPNIQKIELERPRNVWLTLSNVALILVNGKHPLETGLRGWRLRIRTRKRRFGGQLRQGIVSRNGPRRILCETQMFWGFARTVAHAKSTTLWRK